ncbi:unnamed protein product [Camellia sinensis]
MFGSSVVDLEFPKVEVRFQDLCVDAFVLVGSKALPIIPNFIFNMTEGGTHVDYVTNHITNYVMSIVNKKNKNANLKAHAVKIHLWVFVNALIDNPAFDCQTKETLTIRQSSFGSKCELSQEFLKKDHFHDYGGMNQCQLFCADQIFTAKYEPALIPPNRFPDYYEFCGSVKESVDSVVYLVDAYDKERFAEAKKELDALLSDNSLANVPCLILGNKIDIPYAASEDELRFYLGLTSVTTGKGNVDLANSNVRPIEVFMCSIVRKMGYGDGFKWLSQYIK